MEILKRQKWRPRSLLLHFAAPSNQPGQHCVVKLVLSVILRNSLFFFAPMFSHCTGVFKESGHTSFFMKCYLLVFKNELFFPLVLVGPHHEISSFHFMFLYWCVRSTIFIIPVLTRQFVHTGSCSPLQGSC